MSFDVTVDKSVNSVLLKIDLNKPGIELRRNTIQIKQDRVAAIPLSSYSQKPFFDLLPRYRRSHRSSKTNGFSIKYV